jgi:transcriptional regulator with XRE-family HTH domain
MAVRYYTTAEKRAIDKHVGSRVRMRRIMLAMSQQKLAHGLGLTFQQVQKYEKGSNRIGAGPLQEISRILQVPVAFFFEGAPSAAPRSPDRSALSIAQIDDFVASSDGLRLIGASCELIMPICDARS